MMVSLRYLFERMYTIINIRLTVLSIKFLKKSYLVILKISTLYFVQSLSQKENYVRISGYTFNEI